VSPTYEQRYVVGWESASWDLNEKHNSSTGERTEEPHLLMYVKSSCSPTSIAPCSQPESWGIFKNLISIPGANFLTPIASLVKQALKDPANSATVHVRATDKSDEFTRDVFFGNTGGLAVHLQPSYSQNHGDGDAGGGDNSSGTSLSTSITSSQRHLLSYADNACFDIRIDDTWDLNACGMTNEEGVWAKGQIVCFEDRSNDAVLLLPAVYQRLFAEGSIKGHKNKKGDRSYYTITAPLELQLDGYVARNLSKALQLVT